MRSSRLLVHGILHLLGFEHEEDRQRRYGCARRGGIINELEVCSAGGTVQTEKGELPDRDALREVLEQGSRPLTDRSPASCSTSLTSGLGGPGDHGPRIDMVTVQENATRETVLETIRRFGHSRIP
jgi:hypothetical protein